jgi:hypothetical protein
MMRSACSSEGGVMRQPIAMQCQRRRLLCVAFLVFCFSFNAVAVIQAETQPDYLILNSIGDYHSSGKGKCSAGPGLLGATDHFSADHTDATCRTGYYNVAQDLAVSAEITQHTGSDSDKWLLHEIEYSYRDNDNSDGRLGMLSGAGVKLREVGGSKFIYWGLGGGGYTWLSGQSVIEIKYTDLQRTKPEPLDVIKAYLQKFPSTMSTTMVLDDSHTIQWLKDEMDRRLWLCDKWFAYLQTGKTDQKTVIQNAVKSMNIFLDYREKYFGISATDDKNLLAGYLNGNDGTSIKNKLSDYKSWRSSHKTDAISL